MRPCTYAFILSYLQCPRESPPLASKSSVTGGLDRPCWGPARGLRRGGPWCTENSPMHLVGDSQRQAQSSVEARLDWYFEAATMAFEMAVGATMRERDCSREEAIRWLDGAWRRRSERKFRGR